MSVQVKLLGGFGVTVDGVPVASDVWGRRQAAQLVQLLALTRDRRMHREQVIDALWPGLSWDAAAPRLHKAAHYARRALDDADAVVLRQELVGLFPGRDDVEVDVHEFTQTAQQALRTGDATLAAEALEWYAGPLLPDDPYAPWSDEPRTAARQQHLDLLRLLGRWDDVLAEEPADEEAHLALARARAAGGDVRGALVQLERLEQALRGELGAAPGPEAVRLRAELERSAAAARGAALGRGRLARRAAAARLFGRRGVGDQIRSILDEAARGGASPCWSPVRPEWASRRSSTWPTRWPAERAGRWRAAPPRRWRARGPTRRCSKRSAHCAVATRRCWTAWATTIGPRSSVP